MKKSHLIALVIIIITIAAIIIRAGDYSTYETFTQAAQKPDKEIHVVGVLAKDKELIYNPAKDPNYFSFWMEDKEGVVQQVVFRGPKPQDFEKSEQIVLTGKMADGYFEASQILMKCPSKYVDNELQEVSAKAID